MIIPAGRSTSVVTDRQGDSQIKRERKTG